MILLGVWNPFEWYGFKVFAFAGLALIPYFLVIRKHPLNLVYGLVGTRGSIRVFFFSFLIINTMFGLIYYMGFFRDAKISYDVNLPHICFSKEDMPYGDYKDTIYIYSDAGISYFLQTKDYPQYQSITCEQVFFNTFVTSLIQEPSDLFAAASTFNEAMYDITGMNENDKLLLKKISRIDYSQSTLFHWILIVQILISWILLGVFISILYNKFRYES